jgi:pimeloyl-ACP methyl ester carboxylesterase
MRTECRRSISNRFSVVYRTFFAIALVGVPALADDFSKTPASFAYRASDEQDKIVCRFPAKNGMVEKAEVLVQLGSIAGLDLGAVNRLLPDGEIDLENPKVNRRLGLLNAVLGRYGRARIERESDDGEPALEIQIDRARMERDRRRAKATVRTVSLRVLDPRGTLRAQRRYGLAFDNGPRKTDQRLIIGVHGFNSSAKQIDAFLDPLRRAGFSCAAFVYPNDQAILDSAKLLSDELRALEKREPKRRVALVTFSMGGLVARAALEDPTLAVDNVDQLIMIAPPNQGTVCARFAHGIDIYEHLARDRRFAPRQLLFASTFDGLAEAGKDMCPGSTFLKDLNARGRNEKVRYSIVLGEGGELDVQLVERITVSLDKLEQKSTIAQVFGPRLDKWREDLAELAESSDGVVSVRRGWLDGVDDVSVLRFDHLDNFRNLEDTEIRALHGAILDRLNAGR